MLSFVREHRLALLLIAAYALMAHMLLLLNDLPYWDGWYYFFYVENNEAEAVLREWRDNGRILLGQMYWHLGRLLGTLTGFRALMVGCIAIASMLLYALLLRHARLTRTECLAAALLNCSFPATQVNLVSTAFPYTLAMPFFLGGTLLLMESAGCSGRRKLLLRIAANACLLASYISEAYVLAGLPLPLLVWAKAPQGGLRGILRTYRKHADILLGSLSYLYVMMFLMPVSGHYAHSRNLSLNPASLTSYYLAYIGTTLDIANMFSPLPTKLHRDVNLLLAIAIVVIGLLLRKKFADKQGKHYATVALLSFLLLSAIATPFVTAQRATATMGWDIRHVAPAGFAAAIIVVCAVGYFLRAPGGSRRVLYAMAALSGLAKA
ncbi:MAG: hypothetical protein EBV03_00275 [Proteobacteria bacterium]|nr:hypothetical protein [Pseudomonadota bacterium]